MARWGPHAEASARTSDEARAGRSEREWLLIADPARAVEATRAVLAAGGADADRFFRLGFGVAYAAYSRRDWELNTLFIDADDYTFRAAAGHELIDARSDWRGIPGYLDAQNLLLEIWADLRIELAGVAVRRPEQVVTLTSWRGRAARSGVSMAWLAVSDNRFRDGLAVAQTFWWDRQRAQRDLGFPLPAPPRDR